MDLGNYGIGGNEVKIDASEGIAEIPQNRTLLVEQLTKDEPVAPFTVTLVATKFRKLAPILS